ncbi:hypothetical protein ACIQM4_21080 [Streptomyces sp. NPDC091272]|uniref:hypothetical protein n=1 Tax=Streptomyces sp. NPDC091272 TaxID=3365981 RepID=UPI003804D646
MKEVLRRDRGLAEWPDQLEGLEPVLDEGVGDGMPDTGILPTADELPAVLLDLAVPHEDINPLVALRRTRWLRGGAVLHLAVRGGPWRSAAAGLGPGAARRLRGWSTRPGRCRPHSHQPPPHSP